MWSCVIFASGKHIQFRRLVLQLVGCLQLSIL